MCRVDKCIETKSILVIARNWEGSGEQQLKGYGFPFEDDETFWNWIVVIDGCTTL